MVVVEGVESVVVVDEEERWIKGEKTHDTYTREDRSQFLGSLRGLQLQKEVMIEIDIIIAMGLGKDRHRPLEPGKRQLNANECPRRQLSNFQDN